MATTSCQPHCASDVASAMLEVALGTYVISKNIPALLRSATPTLCRNACSDEVAIRHPMRVPLRATPWHPALSCSCVWASVAFSGAHTTEYPSRMCVSDGLDVVNTPCCPLRRSTWPGALVRSSIEILLFDVIALKRSPWAAWSCGSSSPCLRSHSRIVLIGCLDTLSHRQELSFGTTILSTERSCSTETTLREARSVNFVAKSGAP